jgi:type IV secretory pathway VirB3-like protein
MPQTVDTLFVAMTRPAMKWGVPWDGFVANALGTVIVTIVFIHRPPGFFLGVLIHFALRELCRIDPHFFGKWRVFAATRLRSGPQAIWVASHLLPSRRHARTARGLVIHA